MGRVVVIDSKVSQIAINMHARGFPPKQLTASAPSTIYVLIVYLMLFCCSMKLGWRATGTTYCQMVRDVNKTKRLAFALDCYGARERFDDVIFTDESSIRIDRSVRTSFHRVGEPRKLVPKPKHPYKVRC